MSRLLLLTVLASGCLPQLHDPDDHADDTDVGIDDSEAPDAGPACDGTRTLDLSRVPDVPGQQPTTWTDDDAELATEPYDGLDAKREDDGCLHLAPGAFRVRLIPTGCGARAVHVRIVDTCGPACTTVEIVTEGEVVASDRNTRSDVPETLDLAPGEAFVEVVIRSRSAAVCGVDLDEAPIPEDLRPEETGALF